MKYTKCPLCGSYNVIIGSNTGSIYCCECEKKIEWSEIPSYGEHMTIQQFRDCVERGGFIYSDGTGYYATADKESNIDVDFNVKDIDKVILNGIFTHVMWYNK